MHEKYCLSIIHKVSFISSNYNHPILLFDFSTMCYFIFFYFSFPPCSRIQQHNG